MAEEDTGAPSLYGTPRMSAASPIEAELAVVGAGAAGLYVALCAAQQGARVALISATTLAQTASYWAQGGLAAALGPDDSAELHQRDTERAGRGLVRSSAAAVLCAEAPGRVRDLERLGVKLRHRPRRRAVARPGGRPLATPRRALRRKRDRTARRAPALRARRAGAADRGPRTRSRRHAAAGGRALRGRGLRGRAQRARARLSSSAPAARRRCGRVRPTRRARSAAECCSPTAPALSSPTSSSSSFTRPR